MCKKLNFLQPKQPSLKHLSFNLDSENLAISILKLALLVAKLVEIHVSQLILKSKAPIAAIFVLIQVVESTCL